MKIKKTGEKTKECLFVFKSIFLSANYIWLIFREKSI